MQQVTEKSPVHLEVRPEQSYHGCKAFGAKPVWLVE